MLSCAVNGNILISLSVLYLCERLLSFMIHRKIIMDKKNDGNAVNNSFPRQASREACTQSSFFSIAPDNLMEWRCQCMIFNVSINCVNDFIPFYLIRFTCGEKKLFGIDVSPHRMNIQNSMNFVSLVANSCSMRHDTIQTHTHCCMLLYLCKQDHHHMAHDKIGAK